VKSTAQWFATLLASDRDRPAVQYQGRMYDWGFLADTSGEVDRILEDHGLAAGRTIGLILRERPSSIAAMYGLLATCRPMLLVAPLQGDAAIAADIANLSLAALVADAEDWGRDGLSEAAAAAGTLGIALTGDSERPAEVVRECSAVGPGEHFELPPGTAGTLLTSGTTGTPKRIPVTYEDLDRRFADRRPASGGVTINALPLVSVGGFFGVIGAAVRQRPIAVMDRFDVREWAELVKQHRPRRIGAPPAVIPMILSADIPKEYFESVEVYTTASAPLDISAADRFSEKYGIPVLQGYGATEFRGAVSGWDDDLRREWGWEKRASVGRPYPHVKLRIVDPDTGSELGTNEVGRLIVWQDSDMLGGREWTQTNDLARIDEDGFLWIIGRTDDVIIRGGFKVQPGDVEEVLTSHPSVLMAAVVGVPDERLGEVPVAAIVTRSEVDHDELIALAKAHLPPYKVPVRIITVDELPLNSMMKINRKAVRELVDAKL